jgi:hypothetical protein
MLVVARDGYYKTVINLARQEEQPAWPGTDDHNGAFMQHPAQQKGSN